ncbi:MAG: hypothetical protein MI754_02485 [Chromatiales bacterium]|nr:hypothetical protein [Chromatiales bacterium]
MSMQTIQRSSAVIIAVVIAGYSTMSAAAPDSLRVMDVPGVESMQIYRFKEPRSSLRGSRSTVVQLSDGKEIALDVHTFQQSNGGETSLARHEQETREVVASSSLIVGASYRRGDFDFNIAGDPTGTQTPNILSELQWTDLDILAIDAKAKMRFENNVELRGDFTYGIVLQGDNQDSDYLGDNRTQEFSRSNNDASDGSIFRGAVGLGYGFDLAQSAGGSTIRLTPMFGYAVHQQNLKMRDGNQTLSAPPNEMPLGPFPGLNSSYETDWRGPWAGLEIALLDQGAMSLVTAVEYHWADYQGQGEWNLRQDFAQPKSFVDKADGEGLVASLDWTFSRSKDWSWSLGVDYERWETKAGKAITFFANGATSETRLNEANWKSWGISLEMNHAF